MFLHLQQNPHSDDSISDDDDNRHDLPNDVLSFQHNSTNKQHELPLPARLDLLKGRFCNQNSSSSFQKLLQDEEVEMPDFNEGDFRDVSGEVVADSDSGEEDTVSEDDEGSTVLSTRRLHKYGPQFIRNDNEVRDTKRKSEPLLCFKESASCSSYHATYSKANSSGIWSKAKPRFSLQSVTHKYGHIGSSISNIDRLPEIMKAVDPRASASLAENHLEDDDIVELDLDTEPSETEALPHEFNLPLMADIFDNLQDKTDLYPHENQRKVKPVRLFQKNSRSHLPETVVDSEDSPEPVDSGSSSDNEESYQHMKITFPGKKMQTMADRFHEALGSSSVIAENVGALNSLRTGIFEKLQQVMQKEKETDIDFSKKLQAGARPDGEFGCVDVNIISRYLDGKLIVCHCSVSKSTQNFLLQAKEMGFDGSKGGQRTIIFNPRVCDNVDLEVGSLIRIHPPWKEVQVGNDTIILCSYFSEV
ncbi:uncharacterized protein LOC123916817 isoform X2 [Trifolium pratense]|uniref:uncharacterized protein LOC123916817 isoform X2 n=1 Tax=Trifolium pratense TaxID=57577 RepID=UPI001E6929FE|nr:uncharacterized protein LOC123916817 isoform X2 [Trifolium pratense]